MNFTLKEDYGMRAVLDLAVYGGNGPVQAREIAQRQRIPEQFLEQLLSSLRRAEVIRSIRGASGGYALAEEPSRLTIGKVLRALSGPLVPTELVEGPASERAPAEATETLVVRGVWNEIRGAIRSVCDSVTIADLLERRSAAGRDTYMMMHI